MNGRIIRDDKTEIVFIRDTLDPSLVRLYKDGKPYSVSEDIAEQMMKGLIGDK